MATGRIPTTANSPLTAKGDIFTYSTGSAKLAVGNDGETIVADSSTATGLRYQGNFAAGKNKIINGDFNVNQRNVTSTTTNDAFIFDRWSMVGVGGTTTTTSESFTPGTAPVAGYEGNKFIKQVISGQTTQSQYAAIRQKIEDVRTFANQTVTFSFWAKADSGTPYLWVEPQQYFGTGGSPSATAVAQLGSTITISTSWARYSVTGTIASIAGKTIGTDANSSALQMLIWTSLGSSIRAYTNATFQNTGISIWGVQLEAGSTATAFQTATGTIQGELAACQRYYYRSLATNPTTNYGYLSPLGTATTTTNVLIRFGNRVPMRARPSSVDFSSVALSSDDLTVTAVSNVTFQLGATADNVTLNLAATGLTQFRPYYAVQNNNTDAYIAVSAEL